MQRHEVVVGVVRRTRYDAASLGAGGLAAREPPALGVLALGGGRGRRHGGRGGLELRSLGRSGAAAAKLNNAYRTAVVATARYVRGGRGRHRGSGERAERGQ